MQSISYEICSSYEAFNSSFTVASYVKYVTLSRISLCPRIPLWHYTKLIFSCWLVIPYFSGAAYVYEHFVRPYLVTRQKSVNVWYVPRKKDVFSKPDDILTAAEKYIEENGPEAFEKMIRQVHLKISTRVVPFFLCTSLV